MNFINEGFYLSIATMYEKVIRICDNSEEYYKVFADRIKQVVIDTDGIGWGFHDHLSYLYSEIEYRDEKEE